MKGLMITLGGVLILALLLLGKVGCQNWELNKVKDKLNQQLMRSNLELGRAKTEFGDANKHVKELEKKLRKEIKDRDAKLTRIGILEARLKASGGDHGIALIEGNTVFVLPETLRLDKGMVYMATTPSTIVALEGIDAEHKDFRLQILAAIRPEPNDELKLPVYFQYDLDLKIEGQLVETVTPSGAVNNYITLWELDDKGKKVSKLTLSKFNMIVEDQRAKRFMFWNPHLDIGGFVGIDSPEDFNYGLDVGISAMSYGLTNDDMEWRFLRLGAGIGKEEFISLTPALYNIGKTLPLVSNLWVSGALHYNLANPGWGWQLTLGAML